MSEQFTLQQPFSEGRTIDGDELSLATLGAVVDRSCDQFLTTATFAGDHHCGINRSDSFNHIEHFSHHRSISDETSDHRLIRGLGLISGSGHRSTDGTPHVIVLEWLSQEIESSSTHRFDGHI